MGLDNKQKVLMAIYTEYQKDIPEMYKVITAENLGIDRDILNMALVKLNNEQYVTIIEPIYDGPSRIPHSMIIDEMMITRDGIEYVEQKLDIDGKLTGKEKVQKIKASFLEQGLDVLSDFAAKVTAEIIKA